MTHGRQIKYPSLKNRDFTTELVFNATRSSGPGGQNVNKVSTRMELRFDVLGSCLLTNSEKELIAMRLKPLITKEGFLILISQSERTQLRNKEKTVQKFYTLLNRALTIPKKRIPTKATAISKQKRLERKRIQSEKKILRKKIINN